MENILSRIRKASRKYIVAGLDCCLGAAVIATAATVSFGPALYGFYDLSKHEGEKFEIHMKEEERIKELFSLGGLADSDTNGIIEFTEYAEALRRGGYSGPIIECNESSRHHVELSVLEKAVKSYQIRQEQK